MNRSGNFTVIVKTPYQRIADYRVEVDSQWTTAQLKELLSESYPSQPAVSQQRLIYAGQLMKDSVRLDEIFPNNDKYSDVHTIHLVCLSSNVTPSKSPESAATTKVGDAAPSNDQAEVASSPQSSSSSSTINLSPPAAAQASVASVNLTSSSSASSSCIMGTATAALPQWSLPFYATQQNNWYTQCYEYANALQQQYYAAYFDYLNRLATVHPNATLATLASAQTGSSGVWSPNQPQVAPVAAAAAPAQPNGNAAPAAVAPAPPAPAPVPGADPRVLNAQGGVDDGDPDNDGAPNDWFDVAYLVLKLALLISMFYSYSSWDKLAIGFGLFIVVYALQRGVQRAAAVRQPPAPVHEAAAAAIAAENERANFGPRGDVHAPNVPGNGQNGASGLTRLLRVFTRIFDTLCAFFITFITSLLPERAPPLVN